MISRILPVPFLLIGLLPVALSAQATLPPPNKATGDEVPVHEARSTTNDRPSVAPLALREPPALIEELPPARLAEGSIWIPGYWWWDTDRSDFEWVKGFARIAPPNQEWRAGHYYQAGLGWRWVPGFWAAKPRPVPAQPERVVVLPGVSDPPTPEWYAPGGGFYSGPVLLGGFGGYPYYRPGTGFVRPPSAVAGTPAVIGPLPTRQPPFGPLSLPFPPPLQVNPGPGIGYPLRR